MTTSIRFIGSHLSTSKGWNGLIKQAEMEGANTFAFFPRSPYGKASKSLKPDEIDGFIESLKNGDYGPLVVHAPYVYNFAASDKSKRAFAFHALKEDIRLLKPIASAGYGIYINIHPGSHVGQGSETGCKLIAEGINHVFEYETEIPVLLETMAGKGTECGRSFEELASIIEGIDDKDNVGVTFDTCHVYDAGYDIKNDLEGVLKTFDGMIGLDKLKAVHLNDSTFGLSSHRDRHANIGKGMLSEDNGTPGFDGDPLSGFFKTFMNEDTFADIPMILETPEDKGSAIHKDEISELKGLVD